MNGIDLWKKAKGAIAFKKMTPLKENKAEAQVKVPEQRKPDRKKLGQTKPTLIKMSEVTTTNMDFFTDDNLIKKKSPRDLEKIINKYDDTSFLEHREKSTGTGLDCEEEPEIYRKDEQKLTQHKKKVQPISMGHVNSRRSKKELNTEEFIDPVTQRECSFIQTISVDHSNFFEDQENKDNDVVICISNLDIEGVPQSGKNSSALEEESKNDKLEFSLNKNDEKNKLVGLCSGTNTCSVRKKIYIFLSLLGVLSLLAFFGIQVFLN